MTSQNIDVAIIGGGPAGLAAAEVLAMSGRKPVVFEAKPSPARKFLMAGKSGLNLSKDEPLDNFIAAVGSAELSSVLSGFGPDAICEWATTLGEPLFTGTSGRVFPKAMKGSPLLRKWLARLENNGAELRTRWAWTGWDGRALTFDTPNGPRTIRAGAVILAMGGASWPRLGSDGAWAKTLAGENVPLIPFQAANMGFERPWSDHFRDRFAGSPVKPVSLTLGQRKIRGEFAISWYGVEGSAIYALSAPLRNAVADSGDPLYLDLMPDVSRESLTKRLSRPRGKLSRANFLRKAVGLTGVRAALLRELAPDLPSDPVQIAAIIKRLPMTLRAPRPIAEAISTTGGVAWSGLDQTLMLHTRPGTFVAGEMVDWEAPTGGYLLTTCIAMGRLAGTNALVWLEAKAK